MIQIRKFQESSAPPQQRGILCAHARDEWNNLSSAPFVIFERAADGFLTGDLHCVKDLVKRDERY